MSKYAISDIHGCYDSFIKMLELINFKDTDELIVIGDIFDRGPEPLKILDYIIDHKNICFLKGNHELMFQEYYESEDISLWYLNGGCVTHEAIINRGRDFEDALYKYIKKLPVIKIVENNILVHAGLYIPDNYEKLDVEEIINIQVKEDCLWSRDNIGSEKEIPGYNIICGHTPVQTIQKNNNGKILKNNGTIYIDCGCCFNAENSHLACIRLDDMAEFYI